MTNEMRIKVREILEDASFNAEIEETNSLEAVHAALTARGADVTMEEMESVLDEMAAEVKMPAVDDELSEEELEAVAGGVTMFAIAILFGITVALLVYYMTKHPNGPIARRARNLMK